MGKTIFFMKNSILLFTLLLSNLVVCQDNQLKKVDALLKKSENCRGKFENLKALQYAEQAKILSEKVKNSERKAKSYYLIALLMTSFESPKESFIYIQKGFEEKYTQKDILLKVKFKDILASNYDFLGYDTLCKKEWFEAIDLLKKKTDTASAKTLLRLYINVGNHYSDKNKSDSAFIYYNKGKSLIEKIPEKNIYKNIANYYAARGQAFLKKNKDSSLYYLQKSYQIKQKYKDSILFLQYIFFGNYYYEQKEYKNALEFYLKAEQNMKEHSYSTISFVYIYQRIAELYKRFDEPEKQKEYEKIYSEKQNKILSEKEASSDYILKIVLYDKKELRVSTEKRTYMWIISSLILLITLIFIIYRLLSKKIKHKETVLTEVTSTLQQKEEIISQKSNETVELQQKVNDSYNELISLAKNNDPGFYEHFQEVYPDFQKKVLEIIPGLRKSELILCAYTFLGFNIKDIADYTSKSVNTIRNRRQNLRKKFNVPTEQDLGIWLRNLIEKNGTD